MRLLAVDTSSDACSVALQLGSTMSEQHRVEARAHTQILMPMIEQLLLDAGAELADLDAIVLGNGPGSFIGMRIAAAVVQGLCFAAGLPLVPVSSLAAVAAEAIALEAARRVVVAQDARMHEVYLACFTADDRGLAIAEGEERLIPASANAALGSSDWTAAGAGWRRYPEFASANADAIKDFSRVLYPRALYLLALGGDAFEHGRAISPERLVPAYLRTTVATAPGGDAV